MKIKLILGILALLVHVVAQGGLGLLLVALLIMAVLQPALAE